jgi:hypothetical protein
MTNYKIQLKTYKSRKRARKSAFLIREFWIVGFALPGGGEGERGTVPALGFVRNTASFSVSNHLATRIGA